MLINANNGTFSGTIIANSINLQGGRGTYKYEDFGIDIGGGSGTSGGKKASPRIQKLRLQMTASLMTDYMQYSKKA